MIFVGHLLIILLDNTGHPVDIVTDSDKSLDGKIEHNIIPAQFFSSSQFPAPAVLEVSACINLAGPFKDTNLSLRKCSEDVSIRL